MLAKIKHRRILETLSQAITEIMKNLGSTRLEKRLTSIARLATDLLDAEVSAILLVKRKGFLTLEASYGHRRGKFQKGREFAIHSGRKAGLTGHIAAKGRIFNAYGNTLTSHYSVKGTKSDHIPSGRCCSLLAIPLKKKSERGARLVGLLRVENKMGSTGRPSPRIGFTKEDEWVLKIFAEAIVVAIENVELVEQHLTQRNRLKRLVVNSPVGIVSVDNTGHVIQYNLKAEQILGYTAKEAIKRMHASRFYHDPKTLRSIGRRLNLSKDGMISGFRTNLESKSGESIPVSLAITRLYDAKKNRLGSVGYFEDLRLIQEKERHLDLLLQASNTISRAKTVKTGLERLAKMMVSLIPSTFCRILLIDETRQYLIPSAAFPVPRADGSLTWEPGLNRLLTISDWPELSSWLDEGKPRLITIRDKAHRLRLIGISQQMKLNKAIQSLLLVPLKVESKTVGILEVGEVRNTERTSFSLERINLLSAIAAQTAVLIDRVGLHEETVRHNHLLRSAFIASTELISKRDPYDVIRDIVDRMRADARASWVSLVFIDERGGVRKAIQAGAEGQPLISKVIRPDGNSMLVMRTGEALAIENAKDAPENTKERRRAFNPIMLRESNVVAALCLPVSLQGLRIGVMWIHYDSPRRFSKSEINAWQLYVNHAAKAYDNARRIDELRRMRDAAEALAKAVDMEMLLKQIALSACEVLQARAAALWWYDSIRDMFVAGKSVACGIPDEVWGRFKNQGPHPKGTAYAVLQKGMIEVRDTQSEQAYSLIGEGTRELLQKIRVRRFLGIALALGRDKFGVLYVDYEVPRRFSKEERETVRAFANQATLALKKMKLLEAIDKARKVAGAVAKVTTLGELSGTLKLIVQETKTALNCDVITLYEYDHLKKEISPEPVMEGVRNKEGIRQYPEVKSDSIVKKMLRRKRMLVVSNVRHNPLFANSRFARDEKIESCLAIPLSVGKVKVGVMFVNYWKRHLFTLQERTNIELFASQAAVAISNAQLYESEQKRTQSLEALHEAGGAITGSLDERKILKTIARQAWQIAKSRGKLANFADIRMQHGSKLKLEAVYPSKILSQAHVELNDEIDLGQGLLGDIGIIGRSVVTGEPQLIPNVHKIPYYRQFHDQTNSELVVPIKIDKDVVGMINVEHPAFNAFDEKDLSTFESLATQAGIAIQNARRYADLKKTVNSLEAKTQLAWMGMASATWRHRIENDARNINIHLHNIREEAITKTAEAAAIRNELAGIGKMAKRILKVPTTVPLSARRSVKPINICDFINKHIEQLRHSYLYKSVECKLDSRVPKTTTVRASRLLLRQALEILYDNAAEAMTSSKRKKLVVRIQQNDDRLEIRVLDTGTGIPSDIEAQLFGGRVKKNRGVPGLGFGLLQAQAIIEQHGGDIKHEPSSRVGTTMLVWLPLG